MASPLLGLMVRRDPRWHACKSGIWLIAGAILLIHIRSDFHGSNNFGMAFGQSTTSPPKSTVKGVEKQKPKTDQSLKGKPETKAEPESLQASPTTVAGDPVPLKGKVVWEVDLEGVAGTKPVLSDKLCIIAVQNNYSTKEDRAPRIVAVDRLSGRAAWEFPLPRSIPGQCWLSNDLVVFGIDESFKFSADPEKVPPAVLAVNLASGKEQWRKTFKLGVGRGSPLIPRGEGSELVLIGDQIAVLNDGLVLLNRKGEVVWHKKDLKYDRISADKSILYASKADSNDKKGEVVAIDPKDGSVKWHYEFAAKLIEPSRPVISGDQVLVATSSPANDFAQRFFSGTQYLVCLNKTSGKLNWKKSLRWFEHGGGIHGDVIPLGKRVYLTDVKGSLLLDSTSGEKIDAKASVQGFGGLFFPIEENTVFTGEEALDLRTGDKLWKLTRGKEHKHLGGFGSDIKPVLAGGRLYFGSLDGYLLCVE